MNLWSKVRHIAVVQRIFRSPGWPWFTAQEREQEQIMVQQQQYPVHSQGLLGLQTILFGRGKDVQRGMPGIQAKLSTMGMVCPLVDLGPTPEP